MTEGDGNDSEFTSPSDGPCDIKAAVEDVATVTDEAGNLAIKTSSKVKVKP